MPEFAPVFQLSSLDGSNGFRLDGGDAYDISGRSVASAGDVNGDGFADLIIGSPGADTSVTDAGTSYVVLGQAGGFVASINLFTGASSFRLDGVAQFDYSGGSVASAGDVNGDGFADLIVGGHGADSNGTNSGSSYVVFGQAGGFLAGLGAGLNLSTLDGSNGFRIDGVAAYDQSGFSVASAGDINGDGFDDVIIAINRDPVLIDDGDPDTIDVVPEGPVFSYVVFGKAAGFASSINLSSLDGASGFRLDSVGAYGYGGLSGASAGDVNGDGFDDLIVGASRADPNGNNDAGSSYVLFGNSGGFAPSLSLSSLDGTTGFRLDGVAAGDGSGGSVASAGDVNGDGLDDLIVGASGADPNGQSGAGSAYVVFGQLAFAAAVQLSSLDGSNGFRLDGLQAQDRTGLSVSSAGDVNGDGFADVLISAHGFDPGGALNAGAAYVVFGRASGFASAIDLASLDGNAGFRLEGVAPSEHTGTSVAAAGDVNGDGFDDLVIGAPDANPNGVSSGSSYVVFGHRAQAAVDRVGTDLDNRINGGIGNDTISGLAGNDTLIAWEGDDIVSGGAGADLVDGGDGDDTASYASSGAGVTVDLGTGTGAGGDAAGDSLLGIENLVGSASDDVLTGDGLANRLFGGAGDDVVNGGAGADLLDGGAGSDTAGYASSASGVSVDLATGAGTGGDAQGDTLIGIENLIGSAFDDTLKGKAGASGLFGGAGDDVLRGRGGADDMRGGGGDDVLIGGGGGDKMFGGGGADAMVGSGGDDIMKGGAGNDVLRGSRGDDVLNGGGGGDILNGGPGRDVLLGRGGADTLKAGIDKDILFGGLGADTFVYKNVAQVGIGSSKDVIKDFAPGTDTLDLARIDADTTVGGNQAFNFIGSGAFSAAGELRYVSGVLAGDVDGDGTADFHLRFANTASLSIDDMLL